MQGLNIQGLKKHPSLLPLYVALAFGCSNAVYCCIRAALKNPDISWHHQSNPEPWNEYKDKEYNKFYDAKKSVVLHETNKSIWELIKE